jgi:hypothetical protein
MVPAATPVVGNSTVTEFGTITPGDVKFTFDVAGEPVAVPGRTAKNPTVDGLIPVTFATIAVAPSGTGAPVLTVLPGSTIGITPVTSSCRAVSFTKGPAKPAPMRVSNTRVGLIATNTDGWLAALAVSRPPAPSVTATAAPIAAHLVRTTDMISLLVSSVTAELENPRLQHPPMTDDVIWA